MRWAGRKNKKIQSSRIKNTTEIFSHTFFFNLLLVLWKKKNNNCAAFNLWKKASQLSTHNLHGWWAISSIWLNHLWIFLENHLSSVHELLKVFIFFEEFYLLVSRHILKRNENKIHLHSTCHTNLLRKIFRHHFEIAPENRFLSSKSFPRCYYCCVVYIHFILHHVSW